MFNLTRPQASGLVGQANQGAAEFNANCAMCLERFERFRVENLSYLLLPE
jgi:hypothetical protein